MKKYNITCSFEVKSSHDLSSIGFSGHSAFTIEEEISFPCPFGLKNTHIEIDKSNNSHYKLKIGTYDLVEQESQIKYLNELSSFLSFLIAKDEMNGHYGTPYIDLKFENFLCKEEIISDYTLNDNLIEINDFLHITDKISIQSNRHFKFEKNSLTDASYHDVISYYYNGLRAESEKSKFFHWFLILEFLEGTPLYSQMFPKGSMFNEEETNKIKALANSLIGDKKGILLSILSRTAEFRGKKLSDLLEYIDIKNITSMQGTYEVSIDSVKEIISARNKLFHRGSEFPTNTLWFKLFPIVSAVVETLIYNNQCIEKIANKNEETNNLP